MELNTHPFTPGSGQFHGIPQRTLPDDCMEYTLIIIDQTSDQTAIRAELEKVKQTADKLVEEVTADYVWQRDSLQLELAETEDVGWYLRGVTEYGDSVDDEWLIVWILRELTRNITNLWLQVYDTDGEFLLIEAASTLPLWLNPEVADNRVWIHRSNLLIIPLTVAPTLADRPKSATHPLTLKEAYSILTSDSCALLQRIRLVEEEAFYRLERYPKAIQEQLHYAEALIPRACAMVLHEAPESIAAAVEAFYLRDPISLKSLKPMSYFPPSDMVTVSVKFTKVLYAQLKSQEFEPPVGGGFEVSSDMLNVDMIGMKLACGYEMLISDNAAPQVSSRARENIIRRVKNILKKTPPADEEISSWPRRNDSEDWLDISYEELERNLSGRNADPSDSWGEAMEAESGWGDKQAEETLKKMVKRFEAFLNDEDAGVEGAEVDSLDISDDDPEELNDSDEDKEVSFDEAEFSRMMREMMGMPRQGSGSDGGLSESEDAKIREVMVEVEEELKEAGAIRREKGMAETREVRSGGDVSDDGDSEVNIDYTLAKNMLASFKGQGGLPGPGGNLLARMGIALPRDEPGEDGKYQEAKGKQM